MLHGQCVSLLHAFSYSLNSTSNYMALFAQSLFWASTLPQATHYMHSFPAAASTVPQATCYIYTAGLLTACFLVWFIWAVWVVITHPGERHTLAWQGATRKLFRTAHLLLWKQHNNRIQSYVHCVQFLSSDFSMQSVCLSQTHACGIHTPVEHWNSPALHDLASVVQTETRPL
jgi:hypothetical protein